MFVSQSPSKVDDASIPPDYVHPVYGLPIYANWSGYNGRMTDGYAAIREEYGLADAWLTNVMKSGHADGSDFTDEEVRAYARYHQEEIEIVDPAVIAVVGKTVTLPVFKRAVKFGGWSLRQAGGAIFLRDALVVPVTHYSIIGRGWTVAQRAAAWKREFDAITAELGRRGLTAPRWLPL
jgi:uracil-DNA glycosylase